MHPTSLWGAECCLVVLMLHWSMNGFLFLEKVEKESIRVLKKKMPVVIVLSFGKKEMYGFQMYGKLLG